MADAPLRESVAPFRESVRAFAEAAAFVRRYGDDRAYRESLRTLQELPFASTFHPFAVTAQWVIEQATSAEQSRFSRAGQDVLSQVPVRTGSRQRMALVNRTPAAAPLALQSPDNSVNRTTDPVASRRQTKPEATHDEQSIASNAWSVLAQVSKLLDELQPSRMVATMIGGAIGGAASGASDEAGLRRTRSSPLARIGRQIGEAVTAQTSGINQPSSASAARVGAREHAAPAGEQESSLSLLGEAVATLWQTEGTVSPSQKRPADAPRPSGPVPRAPSLLAPLPLADTLPPTAERPVPPGEQGRGRPSSAAPQAQQDDEPLADRINRALIEQAWLRGVDLA